MPRKYLITRTAGGGLLGLTLLVPRRIVKGKKEGMQWAECGFDIDDINAPDGAIQGNDSWDSEEGVWDGDQCQMIRFVDDTKFNVTSEMQDKIEELWPESTWSVVDDTDPLFTVMKADILQARADSQA